MTGRDRVLALVVVLVWGVQFPATSVALEVFPPFLLGALRFAIVAVPTVLFVPRPRVAMRWLVGYGLGLGLLEFAFLYEAIQAGMPAGLASLVLQSSAPFTVVLAVLWLRERPSRRHYVGLAAALTGLGLISMREASGPVRLLPVALTLCAGLSWAFGNICARRARPDNAVSFTLWMSVIPPIPMAALSLHSDGPAAISKALGTMLVRPGPVVALLYISIVCTIAGTGIWSMLLSRYQPQTVAPLSMLVPVVGMASSAVLPGEHVDPVVLAEGLLVVAGVLIISIAWPTPHGPACKDPLLRPRHESALRDVRK